MDKRRIFFRLGRNALILGGLVINLVLWLLESVTHALIFDDTLFEAVFTPTVHEVWMRLTIMAIVMIFALVANNMVEARRRAEETATRALMEVDQIFETAADGMRVVDRDFRVVKANDTFAALTGLPKRQIIGRKCYDVFWGPLCDTPGCPLTRVLNTGERFEYDADKLRPDGKAIPCIISATPFRQPDGTIIGIVEDFRNISERKQAERELKQSGERLRELTAHLQGVRERERSRIAREIHDELGQVLTALSMDVRWLIMRLPPDWRELKEKANSMGELIRETVDSVTRICSELRPAILDNLGLSAAIEWQTEEFIHRTGIACHIHSEPPEIKLPEEVSTAVFRIFQEALTNIARHAHASAVEIRLGLTQKDFSLRVSDNGIGVDHIQYPKENAFGLLGVQERVRSFDGEFRMGQGEQGGACLEVVIPVRWTAGSFD